MIDLRSDTVTRPTDAMHRAMAAAEVGDDVYGEDPTVKALERRTAELLGQEAALFVPSGTMANQMAVGLHCRPGDGLICSTIAHVYAWEGGGIARLWGATAQPVDAPGGLLTVGALADRVRSDDIHHARTRLVCLENTQNRGGGRVLPLDELAAVSDWARGLGLAVHLDGARLFNAAVASGIPAAEWGRRVDTVSVCFSKSLGAPVGSALAGPEWLIRGEALRLRKVLGGGMRQAGVIAAAALYALENHVERLAEDHANARLLAAAVERTEGLSLEQGPVETNLVWIAVDQALGTARDVADRLKAGGVLVSALGPQVLRAVTHLDVSREQVERAAEAIERVAAAV